MPAAAGPLRDLKTCIYTRAPDEDFILDLHPDHPQIVIASPCSGHGFKFASVIGEITADLAIAGATPHDISRFGISRLG
jgi:sarcosine oxidase